MRQLPYSDNAEKSVIGCLLVNGDAVFGVVDILGSDITTFYFPAHQVIYSAVLALFTDSKPIDIALIGQYLETHNKLEDAGGASYLSELISTPSTSAYANHYAEVVRECAIRRAVIQSCSSIEEVAYDGDVSAKDLLDDAEAKIFHIAQYGNNTEVAGLGSIAAEAVRRLRLSAESGTINGLSTGITDADDILDGLKASDLLILAARPSVGKTALALNIAANVAHVQSKGVLFFSLEMSKEQLAQRIVCMESRVDAARLRTGFMVQRELAKLEDAQKKLEDSKLFIDDSPNLGVVELRSRARKHLLRHDTALVVIDYLQLMTGTRKESRQVEMSDISRQVKALARELNVPVLALSQLNREADNADSRPRMSQIRESGAIEQDADVVMLLSRTDDPGGGLRLDIAKHRNGPTGIVQLLFDANIQVFRGLNDVSARTGSAGVVEAENTAYDGYFEDEDDTPF